MLGVMTLRPGFPGTALALTRVWLLITILFILQNVLVGAINYTVIVLGWAFPEAEPEIGIWVGDGMKCVREVITKSSWKGVKRDEKAKEPTQGTLMSR